MQYGRFAALLGVFLVIIIAGMGIVELWQPELLNPNSFLKVGGTFAILIALSFLVGVIVNFMQKKPQSEKESL